MKCIRCETDNNLRDRVTHYGCCKKCNHPFTFEPANVNEPILKITDRFFAKAINDISTNDSLYFTPKQLRYLIDKRLSKRIAKPLNNFQSLGLATIICGIPVIALSGGTGLVLIFTGIICFIIGGVRNKILPIPKYLVINQYQFSTWMNRWQAVNGRVEKMLRSPGEESGQATVSSDVSAYSFDRVVVCDSAAIAQLLIANNFHFENNCAVLSITGYPQSIFSIIMEMLRRNPDLKVYALHDASPSGVSLVHNLRTNPQWFQNSNVAIFDLGLSPRQILASRNMFVCSSDESAQASRQLPEAVRQGLSQDELKWLDDGKFVELESFTPQRIIRVLNQGIVRSQEPRHESFSGGSLVLLDDGGYDSEGSIFVADSFG